MLARNFGKREEKAESDPAVPNAERGANVRARQTASIPHDGGSAALGSDFFRYAMQAKGLGDCGRSTFIS
jgi:hypothetical protein